jgi:hypothetical protein
MINKVTEFSSMHVLSKSADLNCRPPLADMNRIKTSLKKRRPIDQLSTRLRYRRKIPEIKKHCISLNAFEVPGADLNCRPPVADRNPIKPP